MPASQETSQSTRQANLESAAHRLGYDMRTPLNTILGLADILQERIEDPETKRLFELVQRSTVHAFDMLDDFLDFVRLGNANYPSPDFGVSIQALADGCIAGSVRRRPDLLPPTCRVDDAIPRMRGDAMGLASVLSYLLQSASRPSARQVSAELLRQDKDTATVRFAVRADQHDAASSSQLCSFWCSPVDEFVGAGLSVAKMRIQRFGGDRGGTSDDSGVERWFTATFATER